MKLKFHIIYNFKKCDDKSKTKNKEDSEKFKKYEKLKSSHPPFP